MKRKRRSFLSTSVKVYLSLNIQAEKDTGENGLLTIPLLSLNTLIIFLWSVQGVVTQTVYFWRQVSARFKKGVCETHHKLSLTAALLHIGLKSLAYGLGVAL